MHTFPPQPYLQALDEQFHFLKPNDEHHNSRRRPKAERLRGTPVRIDPMARRAAVLQALGDSRGQTLQEICAATGLRPGACRRTLRRLAREAGALIILGRLDRKDVVVALRRSGPVTPLRPSAQGVA